jgi:hypothetical protein
MKTERMWHSATPKVCDLCYEPIGNMFYDARIRSTWGCICPDCFKGYGCQLGTGYGQRYERSYVDGRYYKTGG